MGKFLTTGAAIVQLPAKGMYKVLGNELFKDDNKEIFLVPRNFETDNFTWINSSDYDTRCAHGHDVGCLYGEIIKVNLTEEELKEKGLLFNIRFNYYCKDIPIEYLEKKKITGTQINNLFYRMLKAADCPVTPKHIQVLYRLGVCFNINWFLQKKKKLNLEEIYN